MPFICLWICRFFHILMAYAYYNYPGFAILTWVLASFVVQLYWLVKLTIYVYLPLFSLAFFYEYFVNIQKLFVDQYNPAASPSDQDFNLHIGLFKEFRTAPIYTIETGIFILNIICMITLIKTKDELRALRDNFKSKIFNKITSQKSNFLW